MDIGRITFGTACAMCHGSGITVAGNPCSCRNMPPLIGGAPNPFTAEIEQLRTTVQEQAAEIERLNESVKWAMADRNVATKAFKIKDEQCEVAGKEFDEIQEQLTDSQHKVRR